VLIHLVQLVEQVEQELLQVLMVHQLKELAVVELVEIVDHPVVQQEVLVVQVVAVQDQMQVTTPEELQELQILVVAVELLDMDRVHLTLVQLVVLV
tara:strand:+ start:230 stop:517 length:288 start_codon:yes stop_codon:yes gene_type:complete